MRQLPWHEENKCKGRGSGEDDDRIGLKPVLTLALVEDNLETAERNRNQYQADPVDIETAREPLSTLLLQHIRLDQQPLNQEQGRDADRHIDEEDPVPGHVVGDPASDGGTDRRRNDHRNAIERKSLRTLLRRKRVGQDRLLARHHAATAESLENAEED